MLLERRTPWPRPDRDADTSAAPLDGAAAAVTFIGHSTFLIQTAAGNVLTDPIYSRRAGPLNLVGPRRVRRPAVRVRRSAVDRRRAPQPQPLDHCDVRTLRRLARRFDPLVIDAARERRLGAKAGIRKVEELDWWQPAQSSPVPVTATPARHFSARSPFDRNRALWSGFVLEAGGRRIYFAGDTAHATFFAEIPARLGPLDLALLPIGAYEPRWFMQSVHMNPAEAMAAHLALGHARRQSGCASARSS